MVALAIKLTDAGVGDYWEDIDQYIRNQLVEQQLVDGELLKKVSEGGSQYMIAPPKETSDRVIERNLGAFIGDYNKLTVLTNSWVMHCCTANGTQALYYAWESIVRCEDDFAKINLLLNRASPWLDIDSYLPYEGKVVIKNKTAKKIAVRIPRWVNKRQVQFRVNNSTSNVSWLGNYAILERVSGKDAITIEFPIVETTEKYTLATRWMWVRQTIEYTCHFKGNTLIEISPRDTAVGYPIYQRKNYSNNVAPTRKVARYVTRALIQA
jgi:hypothetical protein